MKKLLCSAVAVLGLSHPAAARTWYILDYGSGNCELSQYSPAQYQQEMRAERNIEGPPSLEVFRNDDGSVAGVELGAHYDNGQSGTLVLMTSWSGCLALRQELIREGKMTDPRELQ